MKKITVFLLTFIILIPHLKIEASAENEPNVSAKGAVLISADTGETVYSKNSSEKLPMASTTKIMTTLLLIESGNLNEPFVVDSEAIKVEGSSMGLVEGDIVTKYDLCCGMLLPSGNDAANASAVCVSGDAVKFAERMNERAAEIGMENSFFVTPSGLDAKGHGASAYDMALLAREALLNETFREICSKQTAKVCFGNPPYERYLKNTNKLLSMYNGVYGVKTGFTDEAGRCLVSACERDGKKLICVTLNDRNDWNDHIAMYDYGFDRMKMVSPQTNGGYEADIVGGECEKITLKADNIPDICTLSDTGGDFEYVVKIPPFLYAPIENGEKCGELEVLCDGKKVCGIPLISTEKFEKKKTPKKEKTKFQKLKSKFVKILKQEK